MKETKPKTTHQYFYRIMRRNGFIDNATERAHSITKSPYFNYNKGVRGDALRYAPTKTEARKHLEWCIEEFSPSHSGETTIMRCGLVGVSSTLDEDTRQHLEVVSWELRHREITQWEIIEETNPSNNLIEYSNE